MENSMEVPQKTKNRATIWSGNPIPGHILGQNCNSKRYIHAPLCSQQHYSQQPRHGNKLNVHQQLNKRGVCVHVYSTVQCVKYRILLCHKKEWHNAICSNMDVSRDYHTKWSKSERERDIPYGITYMLNLIYGTNEPIYKPEW